MLSRMEFKHLSPSKDLDPLRVLEFLGRKHDECLQFANRRTNVVRDFARPVRNVIVALEKNDLGRWVDTLCFRCGRWSGSNPAYHRYSLCGSPRDQLRNS